MTFFYFVMTLISGKTLSPYKDRVSFDFVIDNHSIKTLWDLQTNLWNGHPVFQLHLVLPNDGLYLKSLHLSISLVVSSYI